MSAAESRPHPRFLWTCPRVQSLPLSQKRMLDYLWTGPDVNGVGVTLVEPGVFQSRIGEIGASIVNCLIFLEKAGLIIFDKATMEVFVLDWFRIHKFDNPVGRNAYAKGLRETRSKMLPNILEECFRLAGHKTVKTVDKSTITQNNQIDDFPTPTSSSSSSSSSSSTPPPTSGAEHKAVLVGSGILGIFLEASGDGASKIQEELDDRLFVLEQDLSNASASQAEAAGHVFAAMLKNGKVNESIAGLARKLCQMASKGQISKADSATRQEKMGIRKKDEKSKEDANSEDREDQVRRASDKAKRRAQDKIVDRFKALPKDMQNALVANFVGSRRIATDRDEAEKLFAACGVTFATRPGKNFFAWFDNQ